MKVLDTDLFRDEDVYMYAVGLGIRDDWVEANLLFSAGNFPFGNNSFVRLA